MIQSDNYKHRILGSIASTGMLRCVALVTLLKEALSSCETLIFTRATRRNMPEEAILHSHRRENHKSYTQNIRIGKQRYYNYNSKN
jgi:hypothetical protein